jgi:crotonobetainyl-CoA:carnitine CoA-transferase CaiB-like acyl-CoA transferase
VAVLFDLQFSVLILLVRTDDPMSGPLSHLRVLDLSRILAGPWAGQVLADLGADVIKVERPGVGDDTRSWGPPYLKNRDGSESHEAGYFLAVNRGKRSIELDLSTAHGQDIVCELATRSDILIENYKVGTLSKFGLGYEHLKKINPALIYCSVTGFGLTGPRRETVAYDFIIQAMGGLMSITGERDDLPGGGPQKVGVPIIDIMTGMYVAVAVLAAWARRERTGQGEHIDIGMLDVAVASLANQAMNYLITDRAPKRAGNKHPNIQPQDVFRTSDGYVALAIGNDAQFVKFCDVIDRSDLATDQRFVTNAARVRNLTILSGAIAEALVGRDSATWVDLFEETGVPCGPINPIPSVFADPQVVHRQMLVEIAHPTAGTVPMVVSPMHFTEAPLSFHRAPPLMGQHSEEILRELGIEQPIREHVVPSRRPER